MVTSLKKKNAKTGLEFSNERNDQEWSISMRNIRANNLCDKY